MVSGILRGSSLKNKGELDPKKCTSQLGIAKASYVSPPLSSLSRRGRNKDDGTSFKLTAKGITVKYISKATKKRIRLSTFSAAQAAVIDIMDDVGAGDEALPDDLSGGAGDAEDGLDSVSALDDGEADEMDGAISDSDSKEEEDTKGERNPPRIRSWRDKRCLLSKDLHEPAPSDERITWDSDFVGLDDGCDDLEDPEGYYMTIGCSNSSSDDEIDCQLKRLRKKYRSIALKCHPDKTKDSKRHNKFRRADAKWNRVSHAFDVLGKVDDNGCYALRVDYDLDGERRRNVMEAVRCLYKRILFDLIN